MNSNCDIYIYIYHLKIFISVHLFHEPKIANSWKTNMEGEVPFHWRRRNREKAKKGENCVTKDYFGYSVVAL